jgi:imidazolonepropionase-like amidohydrolase
VHHGHVELPASALFGAVAAAVLIGPPPLLADDVVLSGVTVIDGSGRASRPGQDVVVRDGRIAEVRPHRAPNPSDARTLDLSGLFVLPGFVDMHAHVTYLRDPDAPEPGYDEPVTLEVLRLCLAHGITTVRNPMAPTREGVALREAVAAGRVPGPRIFTAGWTINGPQFATEEQVRKEVRAQAAAGVDFVKVYAGLPEPLVHAAIAEAHARGIKVIGHLQETTWTEAARDGIDFIAHGAPWSAAYLPPGRRASYLEAMRTEGGMKARLRWLEWVDPSGPEVTEMVSELVRREIPVDPTLVAYETKLRGDDPMYVESADLPLAPASMLAGWRSGTFTSSWTREDYARGHALWPKLPALVGLYFRRGIRLLAGSDLPNPWVVPGAGFHRELELLVHSGIPPLDVLSIATRNGAVALGLDAGAIEPGRRADLVVLDADPVADIRNTRRIRLVMKDGRVWRPAELLAATRAAR